MPVGFALIEKSFGGAAVAVGVTVALWVAAAPVPVTVIVYVPVAVAAPTASVSVALPASLAEGGLGGAGGAGRRALGWGDAGRGGARRASGTAPLVGFGSIERSVGAGASVREMVVLWVALVRVQVAVTVKVPPAAVRARIVSVELPPAVTDVGLNEADAPAGTPLAL